MSLVHGIDSTSKIIPLLLDANGQIIVSSATLAANSEIGIKGYIGGAWQKQPLLLGYSDTLRQVFASATLPAGNSDQTVFTVSSNEVWTITNLFVQCNSTTITYVIPKVDVSGTVYTIAVDARTANPFFTTRQCNVSFKAGDKLIIRFENATLNDIGICTALGYKTTINL